MTFRALPSASWARRAWAWLRCRKIELAIFFFGILLRLTMSWNYDVRWSYDTDFHFAVVEWIAKHGRVPQAETTFEAFHPPLYYATAAGLLSLGMTRNSLAFFSIACGVVRLALIWAGLELFIVRSRWARVTALALAATLAASVHLDGMVYSEAMSCMLCALVMLLAALAFKRSGAERWPLTCGTGFVLGVSLLTKISALAVLGTVGLAVLIEFLWGRQPFRVRFSNAVPWLGTLIVCFGISGWYFARNLREYGIPVVTSFTLPSQSGLVAEASMHPVPDRRSIGFLLPFDASIYKNPFRPAAYADHARFFPLAIASSVVDYWQFGFQGYPHPFSPKASQVAQPIAAVRPVGRLAVVGGTVVFWSVVCAWVGAAWVVGKRRDMSRVVLLLMLPVMLLSSLHFAVAYPIDDYGVVKGVYMTFAAPPLYALFGVACGWARQRPCRWPLLGAFLTALVFVAAYTVRCRLGIPFYPGG